VKITHVIVGLNFGGAELMLKRLIAAHDNSLEYEHCVISLTSLGKVGEDLRGCGVKVSTLGLNSPWGVLSVFLKLRHEISTSSPDIVQTWMYHADFLGGLAARSVGIRRIIWGVRTTEIESGGSKVTQVIRKACALLSSSVPSIIVCAANASRIVHEAVGYDATKMLVLSNGFDVFKLKASGDQVESVRRDANLACEFTVIGSVGRFNKVKDQYNFVQAASILAKKYGGLRFLMVGRDLDTSNVQLMRWISETGVPEVFVLLGEREDVPACLAVMNIFCLHSRTEGFPNVLGEAMAMGRPSVVTDVGDAAFLLGDSGVVVAKENPELLANGIERLLLLARDDLEALGCKARERILNHFTMGHAQKNFERLYQKLLNKGL
jgi:glycosyltransferase involved in cell wall biosynthesis